MYPTSSDPPGSVAAPFSRERLAAVEQVGVLLLAGTSRTFVAPIDAASASLVESRVDLRWLHLVLEALMSSPMAAVASSSGRNLYAETAPLLRSGSPELLPLSPIASSSRTDQEVYPNREAIVSPETHMSAPHNSRAPAMSRKAALSAYMAIAASAFGLISDGCEYIVENSSVDCNTKKDMCRPQ